MDALAAFCIQPFTDEEGSWRTQIKDHSEVETAETRWLTTQDAN
jgi:hypothetical protein